MRSFEHDGVTFFHNNTMHPPTVHIQTSASGARIEVPLTSLLAFVAEVVRRERIDRLEQAADLDVLFGTVDGDVTVLDKVTPVLGQVQSDVRKLQACVGALTRRAGL